MLTLRFLANRQTEPTPRSVFKLCATPSKQLKSTIYTEYRSQIKQENQTVYRFTTAHRSCGTCLAGPRRSSARFDPWGGSGILRPRRRSAPSAPGGSGLVDTPGWCAGRSRTKLENTFSRCLKKKSVWKYNSCGRGGSRWPVAARDLRVRRRWSHNGDLGGYNRCLDRTDVDK